MHYTRTEPTPWFINLPAYPRQVRTNLHAPKLLKAVLSEGAIETVECVSTVVVNSVRYKLDGHTRSHLWSNNFIPVPPTVTVTEYIASDMDAANKLFDKFNHPVNHRTIGSRISGIFKELNVQLSSPIFLTGKIASVLRILDMAECGQYRNIEKKREEIIGKWIKEIETVDPYFQIQDSMFHQSGVVAGALLTARRSSMRGDMTSFHGFWDAYRVMLTVSSKNPHPMVATIPTMHPAQILYRKIAEKSHRNYTK